MPNSMATMSSSDPISDRKAPSRVSEPRSGLGGRRGGTRRLPSRAAAHGENGGVHSGVAGGGRVGLPVVDGHLHDGGVAVPPVTPTVSTV